MRDLRADWQRWTPSERIFGLLTLVRDDWRRGDCEAAETAEDEQDAETREEATALAFAGLSLREAATRSLGC